MKRYLFRGWRSVVGMTSVSALAFSIAAYGAPDVQPAPISVREGLESVNPDTPVYTHLAVANTERGGIAGAPPVGGVPVYLQVDSCFRGHFFNDDNTYGYGAWWGQARFDCPPGYPLCDYRGWTAGDALAGYQVSHMFCSSSSANDCTWLTELWDGDPLWLMDTTCNPTPGPIPGTKATFVNLSRAARHNLRVQFKTPITYNCDRVWIAVSQVNGCRGSWLRGGVPPTACGEDPADIGWGDGYGALWGCQAFGYCMTPSYYNAGHCCTCNGPHGCKEGQACDYTNVDPANWTGDCQKGGVWPPTCPANCLGYFTHPTFCSDGYADYFFYGYHYAPYGYYYAQPGAVYAASDIYMIWQPVSANALSYTISGNEIKLVAGGTQVWLEERVTPVGAINVKAWQGDLTSEGYTNNIQGTLTPWTPDCTTDADCQALMGPLGSGGAKGGCGVPGMPPNTCAAGFINNDRTDYLFHLKAELPAVDLGTIDYRYGSTLLGAPFPAPDYETYLGSLLLDVSNDARGMFYVGFNPLPSQVADEFSVPVPMMGFVPGLITVTIGKCCINIGTPMVECIGGKKPKGPAITVQDCEALAGGSKWEFTPNENCTGDILYDCPQCLTHEQCQDGDACTVDRCVTPPGPGKVQNICVHTPVPVYMNQCCDWDPVDKNADVNGLGTIVFNVDGDDCTQDLCSKGADRGVPYNPPEPDGTPCDDGIECETVWDQCDGAGNCVGTPIIMVPCTTDADCEFKHPKANCNPITGFCRCEYLPEPPCQGCKNQAAANPCDCGARDCGGPVSSSDPVYLFSGEFHESAVDLRIPGRGADFVWARKYRSRIGPNRAQGKGWDGSYDVRIEETGPDLALFDGNTRQDAYSLQHDGTWSKPGFFRVINQNPDESYTLTFEDTSTWDFSAFDGSPAEGKLAGSTDRNGNTMGFDYDGLGRLVTIHDTLDTPAHDRDITIAYNADGFVESVTDWTGRSVTYEYYDGVEPGGNFGDLKSVTTPAVVGTPNGNDFPDGKTTVYTYTTGFSDERLNHDLVSITDPKGQTYVTNYYAHTIATVDPTDPRQTEYPGNVYFDRVVRQVWGDSGDVIDFVYVRQTPTAANGFAITKTIVNDRNGNVREYFYNASNQAVIQREYTGRADPNLPTTETQNRPTGQLRPGDPPYFESRWEYNAHSLPTRVIHPNLNEELFVYDESNPDPRSRGNLLQHCRLPGPLGGDQAEICESFEYDDGFGGCCGTNFVIRHVDGRGNETLHDYDGDGNRIHTTHRDGGHENWEYNQFGQTTAHVLPDNGSGHRRRDEYTYYGSGPQAGRLREEIVEAPSFALTTTYEYDSLGRMTRTTDPRGHDTQYVYNQLDQVVREFSREVTDGSGLRYERDTFYDANDNVVRVDIQNIDEQGNLVPENTHFTTIYEYEILNYRSRTCQEVGSVALSGTVLDCAGIDPGDLDQFTVTEYEYDANRNRTLLRYGEATNGNQPTNIVRTLYDERDLVFQEVRAQGDATQSTTQYDYDANRNRTRVSRGLEDLPRVGTNTYDGYDRLVASIDPMDNVATYHYDANHNRISSRTEGQRIDLPGAAGNVRLSEMAYVYDEMDRLIRSEVEFFDTDSQAPLQGGQVLGKVIAVTEYGDNSQVIRVVDDNLHDTTMAYDTANRRRRVTDAKGNTVTYTYDANSNVIAITEVEKSDLGNPDQTFVTTYAYDNLDRLTQTTDSVGNTNTYGYDSRDNRTVMVDALDHETRYVYDGINRLVATIRDMNGNGADGDSNDIVTTQAWDDTSRLVGQTDDSNNTTAYIYDALNRMTTQDYADCTQHSFTYDVHDNRITATDANGSETTSMYDLLDRLMKKLILPGPDVSSDTTFESFKYDGLSRLVHADDDDSLVTRSYDSLSRVTHETLNGQSTDSLYDGVGDQLTCTYPGGRIITTAYDDLDRKKTISDEGGMIATYDYVGPGRVERREYGNGTRTDYSYDGITGIPNPPGDVGVKRIVQTRHTIIGTTCTLDAQCPSDVTCDITTGQCVIDERTYTWDRMYNKTQRADVRGGPRLTHDYLYDNIYRLVHTSVTGGLPPLTVRETDYALDGVGNREEVAGMPDPGGYVMDDTPCEPADNQMNQYTNTPFDSRRYDKNGNLIKLDIPPAAPPVKPGEEAGYQKVRYISFVPQNPGRLTALRVTLTDLPAPFDGLNGTKMWVGEPREVSENAGKVNHQPGWPDFMSANLQCTPHCMDWSTAGVLHLTDDEIIPSAVYDVQAIDCESDLENEADYSTPLTITTSKWGDLVGTCAVKPCTAPDGSVGIPTDVTACLDKFKNLADAVIKSRADVEPAIPDWLVNITDVTLVLDAFRGFPYPFSVPPPCPLAATAARADTPLFGDIHYDYRNQMVEFLDVETGQRHTYAYDALGRRIAKTVNATLVRESLLAPPARISVRRKNAPIETRYFYDGWQVVEEQDALGLTQATYVYGLYIDEVLNMRRPPSLSAPPSLRPSVPASLDYYYHTDDLYNVMAITDATGNVVERYEYLDYGQPADPLTGEAIPNPQSPISNPYRFTGRRFDPETGWYYYRTRYLDPIAGRFTTRDVIGAWSDTLGNTYTLAASNPMALLDPFGLKELILKTTGKRKTSFIDHNRKSTKTYREAGIQKKTRQAVFQDTIDPKCCYEISIDEQWQERDVWEYGVRFEFELYHVFEVDSELTKAIGAVNCVIRMAGKLSPVGGCVLDVLELVAKSQPKPPKKRWYKTGADQLVPIARWKEYRKYSYAPDPLGWNAFEKGKRECRKGEQIAGGYDPKNKRYRFDRLKKEKQEWHELPGSRHELITKEHLKQTIEDFHELPED